MPTVPQDLISCNKFGKRTTTEGNTVSFILDEVRVKRQMIKESENNRISMEDAHRLSDSNFSEENSDLESSVSKIAYQVMSQLSNEVVNDD